VYQASDGKWYPVSIVAPELILPSGSWASAELLVSERAGSGGHPQESSEAFAVLPLSGGQQPIAYPKPAAYHQPTAYPQQG
jgi:hypothetical protein